MVYHPVDFCKYPFQANLFGLPASIVTECLMGFIKARQSGGCAVQSLDATFLDWIRATLGNGIARHFMIPYNTKFWTLAPSKLNCDWLHHVVPVPSLNQLIKGVVQPARNEIGYNKTFWYPQKGGIGKIADAFARQCPLVNTNCRVTEIDYKRKTLRMATGRTVGYDALILTTPMPELERFMPGAPQHIKRLMASLQWNSILNINLGTDKPYVSQKHWIYFPQKHLDFFRVGFFTIFPVQPLLSERGLCM